MDFFFFGKRQKEFFKIMWACHHKEKRPLIATVIRPLFFMLSGYPLRMADCFYPSRKTAFGKVRSFVYQEGQNENKCSFELCK